MPALFVVARSASGPFGEPAVAGASGSALEVRDRRSRRAGQYTAFGFAHPTRRVLAAVLHTTMEVRPIAATDGQPPDEPPRT